MPKAIIHADLFIDNVLFTDNKIKGTQDANIGNNITEDQGLLFNEESTDTKDDFLIAQMLQCQFDNENDIAVRNEERNYNGNSKVKLSYEKYKILQSDHPIWEDSDEYRILEMFQT